MFNMSNGFSVDFYIWRIEAMYSADLIYTATYFEPTLGSCRTVWEDPFLMLTMGHEI